MPMFRVIKPPTEVGNSIRVAEVISATPTPDGKHISTKLKVEAITEPFERELPVDVKPDSPEAREIEIIAGLPIAEVKKPEQIIGSKVLVVVTVKKGPGGRQTTTLGTILSPEMVVKAANELVPQLKKASS